MLLAMFHFSKVTTKYNIANLFFLSSVVTNSIAINRYQREFGFTIPSRDIRVDDIRVRGTGKACTHNPVIKTTPETDSPKLTKVS